MTRLTVDVIPALHDNYIFLLREMASGAIAIIDPGEADPVQRRLEQDNLSPALIVNTHHHGDHTAGNTALIQRYGSKLAGPAAEVERISGLSQLLSGGDTLRLGAAEARVIDTPGHTSGHIALHFAEAGVLFCGDTLFALGCGRVLEGTAAEMWSSLQKLRALPDETLVYCGHEYTEANCRFALTIEPDNQALQRRANQISDTRAAGQPTVPSRLGDEKETNPFLRADHPSVARAVGLAGADPVAVFAEIRRRKDMF